MPTYNIGDKVSVINDVISGQVIKLNGNHVVIEDEEGFQRSYKENQLVHQKKYRDYSLDDYHTEHQILQKLTLLKGGQKQLLSQVKKTNYKQELLEIDLHIECLVDDYFHLTNFEIMQIQMRSCRMFVEKSVQLKANKVVLIHGKGEGVLRHEIYNYLDRLENRSHIHIDYGDAIGTSMVEELPK